ncbi:hypothetical protein MHBO_000294 [Bonamia ostreae]|uniref:Uncharacterized protein n=1 Tax=Bonamia ostreae TaxID=126728 RepID=A0ABV2AGD6_9EUKA
MTDEFSSKEVDLLKSLKSNLDPDKYPILSKVKDISLHDPNAHERVSKREVFRSIKTIPDEYDNKAVKDIKSYENAEAACSACFVGVFFINFSFEIRN